MPQSIRSGSSFDSLIPALTDNADIVKALKDYHYGTISHPTTQGQENALTTGLVGIFNTKANLAGPTFTGNVVLPSTTSIGNISATELGYLDGVTSAIQTQIGNKANSLDPTFTGTATIPTIISNTINATSATGNTASLYPNITTGTMAIGAGLTTGTLNIATASAGAKTINIGTSTGTVNFNSSINTSGIARPVGSALSLSTANGETAGGGVISITAGTNTTNGSGGSVSITAGSFTANGAAGNVSINAGGGPSTGSVNIQTAMGNTGDIYLGNAGSTTYVGGDLSLETGISGIIYKAQPTPEGVSSAGTLTWTEVRSLIILSQPSGAINLNLPAASSNSSITTDGYSFDWSIVNKSSSNAVTVVAVATNTLDGTGLIPANSSGRFTTRRVSSTSYKTYRIA